MNIKSFSIFPYLFLGLFLVFATRLTQAAELPDFRQLVKQNSAAVVNISTTQKKSSKRWNLPHGLDIPDMPDTAPFKDFLEKFFGQIPQDEGGSPHKGPQSLGSGFIISKDGYIVTNNHVVEDADQIIVRLSDRREFNAELIGRDEHSDIALLKVDANDLPVLKIGDSDNLEVGSWVLAIGSPFGFDHSVTQGIVSAMQRSLPSENYVPFIQTDVAINPGNSGGPLFNLDGEVIGVNSQIYSRTGGFMGLSFAIPINMAMNVVNQLKTRGKVDRGWLGVLIQDVTRELAESFGMDHPHGALVAQIVPDAPADKAGIELGDIIIEFDGKLVQRSSELPPMVGVAALHEPVDVVVLRNGTKKTISVSIGELPADDEALALNDTKSTESKLSFLGMRFRDMDEQEKQQAGDESAAVIVDTVKQGAAADAGVQQGDLILRFDNKPVTSATQLAEMARGFGKGKAVAILLERDRRPLYIAIKVPEEK